MVDEIILEKTMEITRESLNENKINNLDTTLFVIFNLCIIKSYPQMLFPFI